MFEQAKRVANNAVERAAWEADKLRRVTARQRDMELAQRERGALLEQLASTVLDLERRGQLTQDPLKMLAQRLKALNENVNRGEADIQAIRNESFVPGSISINITRQSADDTAPCPTCHQPARRNAAYCSACGARLR
jgi:hypothetical protein